MQGCCYIIHKQKMTPGERIYTSNRPVFFITTAIGKAGKADMARAAGYDLLPEQFTFIAEQASKREDLFAEHYHLKVADHHYSNGNEISNTVLAAANKAEAVDNSFEALKKTQPGQAMNIEGRDYQVMDNQMIIVEPSGHKIALKKPRCANAIEYNLDIIRLIDVIKSASLNGSTIEYLSAFVSGVFGQPTIKEYKTIRTTIGKMKSNINPQEFEESMRDSAYVTGGIDILKLINFIDHSEAQIRTRTYTEGSKHYISNESNKDRLVIIDRLVQKEEKNELLPETYTSNPHILAGIARGFV